MKALQRGLKNSYQNFYLSRNSSNKTGKKSLSCRARSLAVSDLLLKPKLAAIPSKEYKYDTRIWFDKKLQIQNTLTEGRSVKE